MSGDGSIISVSAQDAIMTAMARGHSADEIKKYTDEASAMLTAMLRHIETGASDEGGDHIKRLVDLVFRGLLSERGMLS